MAVPDVIWALLVVAFVAVLCLAGIKGGLDLSTRRSRAEALVGSLVLGGGFSLVTGAWIGWCFPAAVLVLIASGSSRTRAPSRP